MTFRITRREPLLESVVFSVERCFVEGGGESFDRDVVRHPGAVVVMPVDAQGRLGLLRQWRATFDQLNWELPAGTCDQVGESALLTGQRELEEEMGLASDAWTLLHTTQISPGWTDQVTTLFRADNVRYVGAKPQGPEELHLERHWLNRDEARALLESGEVLETTLTIALLHFVSD